MSDRHKVYFDFEDDWSEKDLTDLVAFLSGEYKIALPAGFEYGDSVRSKSDIEQPEHYVDELFSGYRSISILLEEGIDCTFYLNTNPEKSEFELNYPGFYLTISDGHFYNQNEESDREATERIDEIYELLINLYQFTVSSGHAPVYVYGLTGEDERRIGHPDYDVDLSSERLENGEIPGVCWCQIIPPEIVANVGEERIMSVPSVYKTERTSDGAVLLILHRYPDKTIEEQNVADYLGVPYDIPY